MKKKSAMWRNFLHSPHDKLSVREMSSHGRFGEQSVMWRSVESNVSCGEYSSHEKCGDKSVLSQFMLFFRKICFVAIYAVLSRNLFCRNLRAFAYRKIETKIVAVEKRTNIWYEYLFCV